jgi:hypothetical protein
MKTVTPNLQLAQRILRMAKVGNTFPRTQDAASPTLEDWGGRATMPGTRVPNAGQFGAGVILPSQPGPPDPIEPDVLPGAGGGDNGPSVGPPSNLGSVLGLGPIAGEHWLGGTFDGVDPTTGQPIYNPLGYGDVADLGGINYTGVDRVGSGAGRSGVTSGNPYTVASKRAGHSANYWVF